MVTFTVLLLTSMVPLYGASAAAPKADLAAEQVLIWAHNAPFGDENSLYWSTSVYSRDYINSMYAALMRRTIASDQAFVPDLAASMPVVSASKRNWTFTLQDNLKFADGSDLNASSVKFSYTMLLTTAINSGAPSTAQYLSNDSVVVVDNLTVRFDLLQDYAFAPGLFSAAIVSEDAFGAQWEACEGGDTLACTINAIDGSDLKGESGPFVVESYSAPNSFVSLVPNPNYYMADQISLDRIIVKAIEESTAAQAELAAGQINIFDANYNAKADELSDIDGLTEEIIGAPVWQEMYPNHHHPYFGVGNYTTPDRTDYSAQGNYTAARMIRYAITHMVDRDFAANEISGGLGSPAALPVPQIVAGFNTALEPRTYDQALAQSYMEAAGFDYTGGTWDAVTGAFSDPFFSISLLSPTGNVDREQWAARMELELPKIGIAVANHQTGAFSTLYSRTFTHTPGDPGTYAQGGFDISFVGWNSPIDYDPFGLYDDGSRIGQGSCCNVYSWVNATVEDQMTAYVTELDTPTRLDKFTVLQEMFYYNEIVFPIIYEQSHWAYADNIVGLAASSLDSGNFEWENVEVLLEGPTTITNEVTDTATATDVVTTTTEESPVSIFTIFLGMFFTGLFAIYRRRN